MSLEEKNDHNSTKPSDLCDLKKQRGTLKGRLTLFEKYISKLQLEEALSSFQKTELLMRIDAVLEIFKKFNEIQGLIENSVDENDLEVQLEYRDSFEKQYFSYIALGKKIIADSEESASVVVRPSSMATNIRLPEIKLPTFVGSYDHWLEFRNAYITLIHKRTDIDLIQKFHYLRSSLAGSALQVINALEFTAANYSHAWELLENRFHNDRLLVHNHVQSLFNVQPVKHDSPTQIRKLIDTILRNLRALNTLQEPTDSWDTLLIYLIVTKLDMVTEREWERYKGSIVSSLPGDHHKKVKLEDLLAFLRNRADMLEMINANHNRNSTVIDSKKHQAPQAQPIHSYVSRNDKTSGKRTRVCVMCSQDHALYTCPLFLNSSVQDRLKVIEDKKLCRNCLRAGHAAADCLFGPCKQCPRKHNTLVHPECSTQAVGSPTATASAQNKSPVDCKPTPASMHSLSALNSKISTPVILSTALVEIADTNNTFHTIRALLDNGSQHCFISEETCKRLNTRLIQSTVQVSGVGQSVTHSSNLCEINMRSKINDYNKRIQCYVLPCITSSLPSASIDINSIRLPENVQLADPTFYISSKIDLLIGADIYWDLINEGIMRLPSGPHLQNSKLGWLVSGPLHTKKQGLTNEVRCCFTQSIDLQLRRFWELEEVPKATSTLSLDERKCEEIFVNTTKRENDGRFSVRIPLKESPESLGDSYTTAKKRLLALERKLEHSPESKQMYSDFLREYSDLGHMSQVDTYSQPCYFLPHHGVFRESSSTTKLRVVYNASSPTTSNKSLNDIQYVGPAFQNDIFSILLRFRRYRYVACADVEKMYRQILIQEDQRNLQLILWREKPTEPISVYQLNTVTYGTASAPYLSIRCLMKLAHDCEDDVVSRVIKNDFYIDDLITGHDDAETLLQICKKTSDVLQSACFPLRKWTFNFDIRPGISRDLFMGEHTQDKTLGLGWYHDSDELHFTTKIDLNETAKLTKRQMLSIISQIYDPLGLLAPAVIISKILLQKLWLSKIDWDDFVPTEVVTDWNRFIITLNHLHDLRIPRFVRSQFTKRTELHVFTDASQSANGACAYVRTYDEDSEVNVKLLCAKSRVAPLKAVSVPRLELCAALLGARLYKSIIQSLRLAFDQVHFWTDSTIVMGWLRMSPHLLKTFVQNRVTEINELTGESLWLHVNTKDNPADLVSRGIYLDSLHNCSLWWNGPHYLQNRNSIRSDQNNSTNYADLPELKSNTTSMVVSNSDYLFDFDRYSSYNKLKRIGAYVLRFIGNLCAQNRSCARDAGPLSVAELSQSELMLTRISQMQSFPNVYNSLLTNLPLKSVDSKQFNKIAGLNIFLDEQRIIRVGGRLCNSSEFDYDKKHPMLICSQHRLTLLLFIHEHTKLLHAGPQLLLFTMRQRWWPLGGRNLARKVVHQCVKCTRLKGKTLAPIMGNLPSERLESGFPFMRVGVDFAGPVFILNRKGRGATLIKGYICLFICFATRCIHLELVSSLSANDYILALKRFISRRGKPAEIFSDNGKNFVGAEKELSSSLSKNIQRIIDHATNDGIKFTFIPPYAPHFGGLWEAGVKSCKHHLRRIVGVARLTYEEFSTVLTQIEAILNSRPMTPLSANPDDLLPLTPAHFLIGRPLTTPACEDLTTTKTERLVRYDRIEQLRQHFWRRWSSEYISELQRRTKWKTNTADITMGSLVLVKEESLPPLHWRLGRVVRVFPGRDGVSRVADIRTANGIIQRAFSKICPLPPLD